MMFISAVVLLCSAYAQKFQKCHKFTFQESVLSDDVRLVIRDFRGDDRQLKKIEIATKVR